MVGPTKNEALGPFSHPIPGYRIESVWLDSELVRTPENTGLILPGRERHTGCGPARRAGSRSKSQERGG